MANQDPSYRAYLLRCWQEGGAATGKGRGWRFAVEEVLPPRRRWGFSGLASLLAFLEIELGSVEAGPNDGSRTGDKRAQPVHDKKGETRMAFQECIQFATENPVCYVATIDGDQPRVRGFLLLSADENGFVFVTFSPKQVVRQLKANPKVEVCFYNNPAELANAKQMRVTGAVQFLEDKETLDKAYQSRAFLEQMAGQPLRPLTAVFRIPSGEAHFWTLADVLKEPTLERIKF